MQRAGRPTKQAREARLKALGVGPDFPLSPYTAKGVWCKTIRGKRHTFGPLGDPAAALRAWREVEDELRAGVTPKAWSGRSVRTVADLRSWWLGVKDEEVADGRITERTLVGYSEDTRRIVDGLGPDLPVDMLQPSDFRRLLSALRQGAVATARRQVVVTRAMFGAAWEDGLLEQPVRFGTGFRGGTAREKRREDATRQERVFEAQHLRDVLRVFAHGAPGCRASKGSRACVLLAINGGFANLEVGALREEDIDLDGGLVWMLRVKTDVKRAVTLWPETVQAIREARASQPPPSATKYRDRLLLTSSGRPWCEQEVIRQVDAQGAIRMRVRNNDAIGQAFQKAMAAAGHRLPGCGFGKLRATHRTAGDGAGEHSASRVIMGQEPPGIDVHYLKQLQPGTPRFEEFLPRLHRVTDHVRAWLWPTADAEGVVGRIG